MLKEHFPEWKYSAPASAEAIADAEVRLGARFPDELRALYLETNGVRESEGNAAYLLPLSDLIMNTKSEWAEWEGFRPEFDLKPFIFFGFSTRDEAWGISWKQPGQVIAFHHHMEALTRLSARTSPMFTAPISCSLKTGSHQNERLLTAVEKVCKGPIAAV